MDYRRNFIYILWFYIFTISIPLNHTFGFDSATSCSPKTSRKGRAQLLASIPCDLKQQAYCNLPGPAYPWHAVRRFVHENQGLMKRMYGDVRHISILRNEIKNNDIDVDDIEETAARYSRDGFRRRNKLLHTDFQNIKTNDVLTEPHFRPASTSTTTTSTTAIPPTVETVPTTPTQNDTNIINPTMAETDPDNNIESNSILDSSTSNPGVDNIKVVPSPNLSQNKTESATISTTLRVVQQIIKTETLSEQNTETEESPGTEQVQSVETRVETTSTADFKETFANSNGAINSTSKNRPTESDPSLLMEEINRVNENFIDKRKKSPNVGPDSLLYQDTIQKDTIQVGNMRGVNACPVKEEVVAPFWANNTRGEVLALLNLYPFEQYVHWEKCTHEHKQMYCRDGCRCEQQYRLHRLLAYDPHNECRGIFSDWFRFPSCCICKCYDIPLEFRSTSRSPRTLIQEQDENPPSRHPVDVAEDEVQRAIYEHATEDWYRPRDEFDIYDD